MNGANELGNEAVIDGAMDSAVPAAANGTTKRAMFAKVARGAFLLMLAVMLVSWAINVGNSGPTDPQPNPPFDRMYS